MKALASTEEHAYVAGAANVGDVYNKIAGGIRNNTSNVKIVDPIAKGFEQVPNTLQVSPGSASVSGKTITWLAGDPSEEYFSGRMTYRVRAVDSILELTESEIYPTNDRTVMSYMSNTGATVERVYTVPTVKPTFITYEKQLTDDYGENVNDGGYVFDVGTKKDAYDKTYQVKPGSAHKVKTVEIYDYGTYVVSEKASTFNGLNNPLTNYTQGIKINGVDASSFELSDDHKNNVHVLFTNEDIRKPILEASKTVTDASEDTFAEAGEILYYTLSLNNTGTGRAKNLIFKDDLANLNAHRDMSYAPDVKVYRNGVFATSHSFNDLLTGINLQIGVGELIELKFEIKIKADFVAKDHPNLVNIASVGDFNPQAEIPTSYKDIDSKKVMTNYTDPKLDYVLAGDTIKIVLTATNIGTQNNVISFKDTLADLQHYINDPSANKAVLTNGTAAAVEYNVSQLMDPGIEITLNKTEKAELVFYVTLKNDITFEGELFLRNVAIIADDEPETEIEVKKPVIEGKKKVTETSGDGYVQTGERITFTVSATNTGTGVKRQLLIRDTLEDIKQYVTIDDAQAIISSKGTYTLRNLRDGFNIQLDPGETFTVTFSVVAKDNIRELLQQERTLRNVALIGDTEVEVEVPFGDRGIDAEKMVDGENHEGLVLAGEKLNYTIEVWNTKDLAVEDV